MFSVVIPLYNKSHTIIKTLQSVIDQTYKNFEIIIINDGSTDNSIEVIQQYFSDKRIKIFNQPNRGVSAARNKGVEVSNGEWISFLDGDDEWHPSYLSIIKKAIELYPQAGMICTGGIIKDINKHDIHYRIASKYLNQIKEVNFFENPSVFSHSSGLSVKKSIFKETHGFPIGMKCCEDFACTQSIALITHTIYIGLPISKYNGGVAGQITSIDKETQIKYIKYVAEYYNIVMNNYNSNNCNNPLFKIYFKYDIRHRFKGYIKEKCMLESFIENLSTDNLNLFSKLELFWYKNRYRVISMLWINFTKIIWKMHRFPVVGEKINAKYIDEKYRIW